MLRGLGLASLLASMAFRQFGSVAGTVFRSQSGRAIKAGDYKGHRNNGYTGAELREIRARNGVGRPPYAKRAAMKARKTA